MANLSQLPVLAAPSVILCPLPELLQGGFLVELLRSQISMFALAHFQCGPNSAVL